MTTEDWRRVITQARDMGIDAVQFIGGEPTQHPDFAELLQHAIDIGFRAEVYTNLVAVKREWWDLFAHPNVSIATSYYSDEEAEHEHITGRRGSHPKIRANIAEALRRDISVRVGIIDVLDGQRVNEAHAELVSLGVARIGTDRMRGIGRGAASAGITPNVSELCGNCGDRRAAVFPNGDVAPCIMSRWMVAGNVREHNLPDIMAGREMASFVSEIPRETAVCAPDCKPGLDGNDCEPAERTACKPDLFKDAPNRRAPKRPTPHPSRTPRPQPGRRMQTTDEEE